MGGSESRQRPKPPRHQSSRIAAGRPSVPGKPQLVPSDKHSPEPDVVTIRWEAPLYDGGSKIIGYLVEHRRTGSPHWVRSSPALVRVPELTLSGLEPGWRYQFRVSAHNVAGLSSEPGELSDLLTVTLQRTAASAPRFVRELADTVALENEKAELTVQVRGTPAPTISWFKDGVEIFSSRSCRVVTDNETSTLVIHQAALGDEGEIKCSATNRVGYAVTRAKLTVEAPPVIRLPRQYEEGLLFEKDEVIRLRVAVAGRPVPEVSWALNGEPVPGGGRYEAAHSERYATLRVGEARRSDRGEYQVRAVNRLGEDVASFLVTVADRPTAPGKAKVVTAHGRSVTLSWAAPADDGGCKIGNYIVEYYRIGWNMWLKAATCRQLSTALSDLIEGSQYKFRAKAENPYGVSEAGPESEVVFIADPKRGLLVAPDPSKTDVDMDVWLDDKKRSISPAVSPTIDEQYGERKTKKKRGPMAAAQAPEKAKDPPDRHSFLSEDSASPSVTPEGYRPSIPRRRARIEKEEEEEKQLQSKLNERRKVEEFKRFEQRKVEEARRVEDRKKAEENKSLKENKAKFGETKDRKKPNLKEPQSPREDRDTLHGSSELMLVLLPHSRATTEERETSKRELFESSLALQEDVAPPMSLSAPELGGEPPEPPPVRPAYSSTELLHERSMARFYQDMARDEAETSLRRRSSLQRRRSFGSRTRVQEPVAGSLQDIVSSMKSLNELTPKQSPAVKVSLVAPSSNIKPDKKTFSRDSMDSMISIDEPRRKPLVQQASEEDKEYEDSSFDEDEDVYGEESVNEEEEEELNESDDEDFSRYDKTGSVYTSSEEELLRSYSLDEDTYHSSTVNLKYNEDSMISDYEGRGPLILGSIPQPPQTSSSENKQVVEPETQVQSNDGKVKPRSILKRPTTDITTDKAETTAADNISNFEEQTPKPTGSHEKRFEPNSSSIIPKPILKVREPSQERYSPVSQRRGAPMAGVEAELNLTSSRSNLEEGYDNDSGVRKKQVRIETPEDAVARDAERKVLLEKTTPRTGSAEEADAAKVMISHYSDIVAEFGKVKRTPRLYMNYESLKAAADMQEASRQLEVPEIFVNEPEPEPETEVKREPEIVKQDLVVREIKPLYSKSVQLKENENATIVEADEKEVPTRSKPLHERLKDRSQARVKKRSPSPLKRMKPVVLPRVEASISSYTQTEIEAPRTPSPISTQQYMETQKKVHSYIDFFMDFSLFVLACWLYLFKDERLSIPVLCLMIYRQANEAFHRKMEAIRNKLPRRILFWRRN